jgi:hypothetical protein
MRPDLAPGTPRQFSYDHVLYDRQFMSCLFRHAVVWLERLGRPVQLLFYNALASTDQVLVQMLVERRPKFAFRCAAFSDADFELIGAKEVSVMAETFRDIRALVLERVQADEFALIEGNVYYLPHCLEYRKANNQHVVVVHGIEEDGRWAVVDDDAASILCSYTYEEGYLARFFENSVNRKLRYYTLDPRLSAADAQALVEPKFCAFVLQHQDSHKFFESVGAFLQSPFDTLASKHHLLHDAFALLSGSRQCFVSYLRVRGSHASLVEVAIACAKSAGTIKMILARAKLTGILSTDDLLDRVEQLRRQEVGLIQLLREQIRCD